jgi:hypothetical protein
MVLNQKLWKSRGVLHLFCNSISTNQTETSEWWELHLSSTTFGAHQLVRKAYNKRVTVYKRVN